MQRGAVRPDRPITSASKSLEPRDHKRFGDQGHVLMTEATDHAGEKTEKGDERIISDRYETRGSEIYVLITYEPQSSRLPGVGLGSGCI